MCLHILQHIRHAQHQALDRVRRPEVAIAPSPGVEILLFRVEIDVDIIPSLREVAGCDAQRTGGIEQLGAAGIEGVRVGGGEGRKGGAELGC